MGWFRGPAVLAAITLVAVILVSCRVTTDTHCVGQAMCVGEATELYYKGTVGLEPWSPGKDGSLPADWESSARRELAAIGLEPATLETLLVGDPQQPILRIRLPEGQRSVALQHCFVANAHDSTPAASVRTDC